MIVSLGTIRHPSCATRRVWCCLCWISPLLGIGCSSPAWYLDPGSGERLAKQENKPLLLYFKEWDSTHHRNMRLDVFANPEVQKEMLGTINVELEYAWYKPEALKYGVLDPQICVMCNPDGKKVGESMYANPVPKPKFFLEWLREQKALAVPPPTSAPADDPKVPSTQKAKIPQINQEQVGSAKHIQ